MKLSGNKKCLSSSKSLKAGMKVKHILKNDDIKLGSRKL